MRTRAAVIRQPGKPWELTSLELDEPRQGEVLIRFAASGMCHSDEHLRTGDSVPRLPIVGGHEGAGVIEATGPGVTRVAVGDLDDGKIIRGVILHA
jgi:S-(hydroxymethyl)glutathione dehydrogenase/alcohol dehydrogenase